MFGLFKKRKSDTPNIAVYVMTGDGDGNIKAFPVGIMPRLPSDIESQIVRNAGAEMYAGFDMGGDSAMAYIEKGHVDAVCFFEPSHAGKHASKLFDVEMISQINNTPDILNHFPRAKLADQ